MPPKIKYNEDHIVEAAFAVVRKYGWKYCTARSIARELGSSTMPIYSYMTSMADLKNKILQKATDLMIDYQTRVKTDIDFLDMGVGYVLFAKEEQNLFRLMFKETVDDPADPDKNKDKDNPVDPYHAYALDTLLGHLSKSKVLEGFSNQKKEKILYHAWIFSHGLAVIINNGLKTNVDETDIISTLKEFGITLIAGMRAK